MLGWSIKLGSLLGIPLRMHWTFLLVVGWFASMPFVQGAPEPVIAGLRSAGFVLAIFGCVVLHELGHAIAARRYGIRTRDITLLPIGGVARLERMPEKPSQELVVALAGPAVNVVIAAVIISGLLLIRGSEALAFPEEGMLHEVNFLAALGVINVFLVVFNLIPAFPMDGGRVLRATLATSMPRAKATAIAAGVGQAIAIAFAMTGLLVGNIFLLLIALFVFLGAGAEAQMERFRAALEGLSVRSAMMTRFVSLRASQSVAEATMELLAGAQQDFPVLADDARAEDDADAIVGVLTRADLTRAIAAGRPDTPVSEVMRRACAPVRESDDLRRALDRVRAEAGEGDQGGGMCPVIPVVRADESDPSRTKLVGIVTPDNLTELVMIRSG